LSLSYSATTQNIYTWVLPSLSEEAADAVEWILRRPASA
jgi:hypothetical protein